MTSDAETDRRRRLLYLTLILLIGLPIYLIIVASVVGALTAPYEAANGEMVKPVHWLVELLIYLGFGFVWVLPLKRLALGLGKKPAEEPKQPTSGA